MSIKCSIGIFAYNEEKNIGRLLEAILSQELSQVEIDEVFVVASGCTDKTIPIAEQFAKKNPKIKVLVQEKREGKVSAINLFLERAKNNILVMESGDTIPGKDAIENLVKPFIDPKVGMTGARPVPVDSPNTFMGFTTNLLWKLHHQISLKEPKMGEMVAFRKLFKKVPPTAVDEAYIEGFVESKGFNVVYVPEAIVYNKGPDSISDFLRQRRRIFCGHLQLKKQSGYQVSTLNSLETVKAIFKLAKSDREIRRKIFYLPGAILLETLGRFLGWWDYKIRKKNYLIWKIAKSTKKLVK